MRYPPDHKERTRRRILDAAAAEFRRSGFEATGVDRVMAEAGLTPGGFYAHFGSKAELFAEAFAHAFRGATTLTGGPAERTGAEWLADVAGRYLSDAHRRRPESGCPLPPLIAEVARADEATRRAFESGLTEAADAIAARLGVDRDDAFPVLATLVGGLSLARAVQDDRLAERILEACRSFLAESPPAVRPAPRKRKPPKGTDR